MGQARPRAIAKSLEAAMLYSSVSLDLAVRCDAFLCYACSLPYAHNTVPVSLYKYRESTSNEFSSRTRCEVDSK